MDGDKDGDAEGVPPQMNQTRVSADVESLKGVSGEKADAAGLGPRGPRTLCLRPQHEESCQQAGLATLCWGGCSHSSSAVLLIPQAGAVDPAASLVLPGPLESWLYSSA